MANKYLEHRPPTVISAGKGWVNASVAFSILPSPTKTKNVFIYKISNIYIYPKVLLIPFRKKISFVNFININLYFVSYLSVKIENFG